MSSQEVIENGDVEATRTAHIQRLMTRLLTNSPIYTILLSNIRLTSTTRSTVTTHLTLEACHVNSRGTLHGAVSATIIDFTTGLAIASWDLRETTGASVDMHLSYLGTARVGEELEIVATADKVGGSMAFATIRISRVKDDGSRTPVTVGQHTKFVGGSGAKTFSQTPKEQ